MCSDYGCFEVRELVVQNDENGTIVASSTVALLQRVVTNSDPFLFDSNLDVLSLICVVQRDGSGCSF